MKTTAYFTNYIYENHKFAFTQTVSLPDSIISLNDMEDIDLNNYVGQSFPREVLEENQDLILKIKDMYYSSGLGFENLWQVNIHENNTISLDYANVEQTQTAINETVELDPVIAFSNGYEISAGVNSTTSTNCPTTSSTWISYLRNYNSNPSYNGCRAPIVEFDISSIPDSATITNVIMSYEVNWINGVADNVDWNTIELKPTGLTVTLNGNNIDLAWTAPSIPNGSILGYKVEVSTDGTTWSTVVADTGNSSTTYTDTNPTMGSLNYYKVSGINAYGTGRYLIPVQGTGHKLTW